MSKKTKQKRKEQRKGKKHIPQAPKIQQSVPQRKTVPLEVIIERVYAKEDLSTTCLRQCTCCRVACPQMKFCEASSIIDHIWNKHAKDKEFLKSILIKCVRYFFSDSLIKPCPLLVGNTCIAYERRPLNCRLYGLWPNDEWETRVASFEKSTGLPREKLPLNTQCPNVRRKAQKCKACDGNGYMNGYQGDGTDTSLIKITCGTCLGKGKVTPPPLTSAQIAALFKGLDDTDKFLGVSDLRVETSWNYRTFHDWVLLKFWGEDVLIRWTNTLLTTTPEQREGLMEAFEAQAGNLNV